MSGRAEWTDTDLVLILEDVEPRLAESLGFIDGRRVFPRDAPYARSAAERFEGCADSIVRQVADREPVPWEDALELLLERVPDGWTLVGSVPKALRGEPVAPHDLDLVSDVAGAERIAAALADLLVEPLVDGGWIGARWWRAFAGARIEGVGGFARAIVDGELVAWPGHELRVGRIG